jgi:hypothetical protein
LTRKGGRIEEEEKFQLEAYVRPIKSPVNGTRMMTSSLNIIREDI